MSIAPASTRGLRLRLGGSEDAEGASQWMQYPLCEK